MVFGPFLEPRGGVSVRQEKVLRRPLKDHRRKLGAQLTDVFVGVRRWSSLGVADVTALRKNRLRFAVRLRSRTGDHTL